jgi:PTS system mannose-specific IIA component
MTASAATPGLLVVTHGLLANELRAAVQRIVENEHRVAAVSIDWDDDVELATTKIRDAIDEVDRGMGAVILTDMFGGTPTNLALTFYEPGRIEVVTGVNLSMLVKFTNIAAPVGARELADRLATEGRKAIQVATGLLDGATESPP